MTEKDTYKPGPSGIYRRTKQKNAKRKSAQHAKNVVERAERNRGKK